MMKTTILSRVRRPGAFRVLLGLITAMALSGPGVAGTASTDSVITSAGEAIGLDGVRAFRFTASGSSYEYAEGGDPTPERRYARVNAYTHEVDLTEPSARVEVTRTVDDVTSAEAYSADSQSPWEEQLAIWMNPYAFLREAARRTPAIEEVTEFAEDYARIGFEGPAGHMVEGYISVDDQRLERIRTWIDNPSGDDAIPVDFTFRFYEETESGHWFPGLIVRKTDNRLEQVLSVLDVSITDSE